MTTSSTRSAAAEAAVKSSYLRDVTQRFLRHRMAMAGLIVLCA